jgi:hypothetical protein
MGYDYHFTTPLVFHVSPNEEGTCRFGGSKIVLSPDLPGDRLVTFPKEDINFY